MCTAYSCGLHEPYIFHFSVWQMLSSCSFWKALELPLSFCHLSEVSVGIWNLIPTLLEFPILFWNTSCWDLVTTKPSAILKHAASEDVNECVGKSIAHGPEHGIRQSSCTDNVIEVKRNVAVQCLWALIYLC